MILPYLHFMGNCRDAMVTYQAVLGGTLETMTYSEMPAADELFSNSVEVMHSALVTESHGSLYASDYPPGVEPKPQQSVDVVLTFQDKAETRRVYDLLSENGDIIQEFGPTFFSPGYAMFQDQFGTHWILMTEQA